MSEPHVVILGGGPAGVGGAYRLRQQGAARVTLLEQGEEFGGVAASFEWHGQRLDHGSHRLHPSCEKPILEDIGRLLGDDLLDRPRHGRIRLMGRWIHFPLKPVDLMLRLPRRFALGTLRDAVRRAPSRNGHPETFASVLQANLGRTICEQFYFPYAVKIWGLPPERLSAEQAHRRVSAGSFGKLVKKVLRSVPGFAPEGAGRFYYPRRGFGQITEVYARAAAELDARLRLRCRVTGLRRLDDRWEVALDGPEGEERLVADHVWSTLPITTLARLCGDAVPAEVRQAARDIRYRSMLLVYLSLPVPRFTEFDAHYFPGADLGLTRLSEPKNYPGLSDPPGSTILCAELPCTFDDETWNRSEEQLGQQVAADLARAGIPLPVAPADVMVRRLKQAYPIYLRGYEDPLRRLDEWATGQPQLLTYGRQGLFAHDNTHHALSMAYSAVDCLADGRFDDRRWAECRERFQTHVVED